MCKEVKAVLDDQCNLPAYTHPAIQSGQDGHVAWSCYQTQEGRQHSSPTYPWYACMVERGSWHFGRTVGTTSRVLLILP